VTLTDIAASIAVDRKVRSVTLVPSGEALAFTYNDGRVALTVPKLTGHQMVEIGY
jgi:hypothetical protein